jgi:large subunit ribosomal protein L30
MTSLKITQVRSTIGTKPKHRGTLRALGLGRIGRSHVLPDRPEIRGMIARVPHMVTVEEVADPKPAKEAAKKPAAKKPAAKKPAVKEES